MGLLSSCATPATSWPSEAIFSECSSCCWVRFKASCAARISWYARLSSAVGRPTHTVPTRRPLPPMRGVQFASTEIAWPCWSSRLSSIASPARGASAFSIAARAASTLASSASSSYSRVPRNCASERPTSSHKAALACSIRPPSSHTTSTSDIEVSTLKMNCCDCSSSVFFFSSSTSSSISRV